MQVVRAASAAQRGDRGPSTTHLRTFFPSNLSEGPMQFVQALNEIEPKCSI